MTTAVVGGNTYLFVAGLVDDGVSVFAVAPDGTLTNVDNVSDDATRELNGAIGVTTAVIAGITYLFVMGLFDDGVSVFAVAADGTLTSVDDVTDDATLELDAPHVGGDGGRQRHHLPVRAGGNRRRDQRIRGGGRRHAHQRRHTSLTTRRWSSTAPSA